MQVKGYNSITKYLTMNYMQDSKIASDIIDKAYEK
jgi:hypothetical protein